MKLRDCALGAVIAASLFVGVDASAKPVLARPVLGALFSERASAEAARGLSAMRFCLGQALDIAGELTALAKQI